LAGTDREKQLTNPQKSLRVDWRAGRDCLLIEFVWFLGPIPSSLPDTFWGEGKKKQVIAESGQVSAPRACSSANLRQALQALPPTKSFME